MQVSFHDFDTSEFADLAITSGEQLVDIFQKVGNNPKMTFKRSSDFVRIKGNLAEVEITADGAEELHEIARAFGVVRNLPNAAFDEETWRFTF